MSKSFRYVKEFEFPSAKGMNKYCGGGKVMKKAEGGDVTYNEAGQKLYVSRPASQTTAVSTTATKTLSKKDQRQALKAQEKKTKEIQRAANLRDKTKPAATTSTTTTAAKSHGGVMRKAEGGVASQHSSASNVASAKAKMVREAADAKAKAAADAARAKEKAASDAAMMKRRAGNPGQMANSSTTGTTTTAAKARGGVMKKADGGMARQRPASASTPLPTRQYSSATREYTPAENQQRAVARRVAMDKQDVIRQKAHDARVSAAEKRSAIHDAANEARKGMNKPGTAANALKLAGKLSDKTSSRKAAPATTGTTASNAMAKAHGGVAHKGMTKKSRGGVPAHSNTPMIRKKA